MCIEKELDTVPGLPSDRTMRHTSTWVSDMDYARTGKVFIRTWGYGRYSFHMKTGKLERLEMGDGRWKGARAPYLGIHIGLATCVPHSKGLNFG
jgi:hypothetical protein